jgi:hypothetical protein
VTVAAGLVLIAGIAGWMAVLTIAAGDAKKEIEAFNRKMGEVTLRMETAGAAALWAEDGVTLLPGMPAIEGRRNISRFMQNVASQLKGY